MRAIAKWSAIATVPMILLLCAMFAPKRIAFYVPPENEPKGQQALEQDQRMRDSARQISGQIASAGLMCALASFRAPLVGDLAIFSDACEGQTRSLETVVARASSTIALAEIRRGAAVTDALDAECRKDPTACQKPEVANAADAGEQ